MNFETDIEVIKQKIAELQSQGYDRIHIPGGTSFDGSFYSGTIVAEYDPKTKEVYFLGVPYCSNYHIKNDNNHNKKSGETPEMTAARELQEETGLYVNTEDLFLVYKKDIPDNRPGKNGKFHTKYFYLVIKISGNPLNLLDFPGASHIDAETAAPIMIPSSLFVKSVFGGHLPAIYASIPFLMEISRENAYALMNL